MPVYQITDPQTGQSLRLTGDSPPTEQELEQIFAQQPQVIQQSEQVPVQQPVSEQIIQQQAEIQESVEQDEGIGPVGADFDVTDLIELGIISPENAEGRTLGEITKDPEIQRAVLELGGMTIGSFVAPQITGPLAISRFPKAVKVLKQLLGAGAGGGAGSLAAEVRDPTEEPLKTAEISALTGVAGEGVGLGLVKIGQKVIAPFKDKLEKGAKEAFEAITARGGVITPGKLTESRAVDVIESVTEASILGGGAIKDTTGKSIEIARGIADEFVKTFSKRASKEEINLLVQDAVQGGGEALKKIGGAFYRRVDSLTEKAVVDIIDTKVLASKILRQSEKGIGSPDVKKLANTIMQKRNNVTFEEAQAIRSDLLGVSRIKEKGLVAGKGEAAAKRLAGNLDEMMSKSAQALNPEAKQAWRTANEFWKNKSKLFNDRIIKNIAIRNPDGLFESAIKHNNPNTIRKIRKIIGDEKVWTDIQGRFVRDIFEKSSNEAGELSGKKLLKQIKKWQEGGSLKALLPTENTINLKNIARTLQITETAASREKVGSIAIQLLQVGAATTVFSMTDNRTTGVGQAAAIIFGPAIMAKMLTKKSFSKWWSVGLKAPKDSKQATMALSKLTAMLLKEGAEEQ